MIHNVYIYISLYMQYILYVVYIYIQYMFIIYMYIFIN